MCEKVTEPFLQVEAVTPNNVVEEACPLRVIAYTLWSNLGLFASMGIEHSVVVRVDLGTAPIEHLHCVEKPSVLARLPMPQLNNILECNEYREAPPLTVRVMSPAF